MKQNTKGEKKVNAVNDNSSDREILKTELNEAKKPVILVDNSHEFISKDAAVYISPAAEEILSQKRKMSEDSNGESEASGIHKYYNTRALPQHAKTYELEKFKKNAMIIFNHENVDGYRPREGTNEDERALRNTFSQFGFEIEPPHKDLTKAELFAVLRNFSDKDFTHYGCVVVVVLTHGTRQGLLRAKDEGQLYHEKDIIDQFKTRSKPTLITKPVILIIQACRGTASTAGVEVMTKLRISKDHEEDVTPYYLPVESDMLIFHSSFVGKPSYRPANGSWFIQTLCNQINELHRSHDLESIFVEVKREVAVKKYYMERDHVTNEMDVNKQMPVVTSTLIRTLYLRKFNDISPRLCVPYKKKTAGVTCADSAESQSEDQSLDTCYCFADHFVYMKTCLSYIVQKNPRDAVAKSLLEIAKFESGVNDEKTKATLILISNHLQTHYKGTEYHKFIYFFDNGCDIEFETMETMEYSAVKKVAKKWSQCSQSYVLGAMGTCVGALVIYNLYKLK